MIRYQIIAKSRHSLAALLMVMPLTLSAEWTGVIEGGKVLDDDNGSTAVEFTLSNNERPLSQEITAQWLQADTGNDSYEFGYRPEYWLTDFTYIFGEGVLRTIDSLSLDNYQRELGAGIGIELINTSTEQLSAEIVALQLTTFAESTPLNPEFNDSIVFTGAVIEGSKTIYEMLRLELDADYLTSDELDIGTTEVGIAYKVSNGAIKYSYRYRTTTFGDSESVSDTDSAISFLYSF